VWCAGNRLLNVIASRRVSSGGLGVPCVIRLKVSRTRAACKASRITLPLVREVVTQEQAIGSSTAEGAYRALRRVEACLNTLDAFA